MNYKPERIYFPTLHSLKSQMIDNDNPAKQKLQHPRPGPQLYQAVAYYQQWSIPHTNTATTQMIYEFVLTFQISIFLLSYIL